MLMLIPIVYYRFYKIVTAIVKYLVLSSIHPVAQRVAQIVVRRLEGIRPRSEGLLSQEDKTQ